MSRPTCQQTLYGRLSFPSAPASQLPTCHLQTLLDSSLFSFFGLPAGFLRLPTDLGLGLAASSLLSALRNSAWSSGWLQWGQFIVHSYLQSRLSSVILPA